MEGDKKVQAEKLISDLNAKDKAFDAAIDAACKNLSSEDCRGMRQELAAMGKSYDAQLDGQYIGTMASVYKEGADQVDGLLWKYATADAQAEKERNIQILVSKGIPENVAAGLVTGMAAVHTAAAIGGAVYGMKGLDVPAINKPSTLAPETVTTKGATASSGSVKNVSINQGQQNKHIPGTNEYKIASDAGLNKSTITVSSEVLLQKVGSGQQVGNVAIGIPGSKERINYGQVIGNYIDPQTGISTPTTNGIVHYGKNGVHIVPARP
ncbi:polymorphic toxin type 50 domain-containing protein [Ewingella docleensis]|uniref:polymorphic toxin type 50 domain-containing protein n=1 Tax=Ewingella docleensis TaxID=3118588 RepID=UPI003F5C92E6